jgi:hypothetical protein
MLDAVCKYFKPSPMDKEGIEGIILMMLNY